MLSSRLFASCLVAVVLCAVTDLSLAEQISGQMQISLTILKRCEITARNADAVVYLSGSDCEHAAYQVRDVDGRVQQSIDYAGTNPVAVRSVAKAGSTLEIYW